MKYNYLALSLLLTSTQLQSATMNESTSFNKGDIVEVKQCDKWGWCELKNGSGYIKKYQFSFPDNKKQMIKSNSGTTYLYKKRPMNNENDLYKYINIKNKKDSINNFIYGYIKIEDLIELEKQNIPILKKTNIKENHVIKIKDTIKNEYIINDSKQKINIKKNKDTKKHDDEKHDTKKHDDENKKSHNKWYIYGGFGTSKVSTQNNTNAILTNQAKDTKASLIEVGIGRYMKNNISAELSYQNQTLKIVKFDQFLLSLNYSFINNTNLVPFLGGTVGNSRLKWSENPLGTSTKNDKTSSEFIYGLNLGVNYKLDDDWYFYSKYQYLIQDHETYISNKTFKHNSTSNILFGLKYDIN